jgi:hypothetical protein
MSSILRGPVLATALMLSINAAPALAARPVWTPVAALLVGSLSASDPQRLSDAMIRCTALTMNLSEVSSEFSAEMAQLYRSQANRFIEHALRIESQRHRERTGEELDRTQLELNTLAKLKPMILGYSQWMDQNIVDGTSLFDKELEMDMKSCELAMRFITQLPVETQSAEAD